MNLNIGLDFETYGACDLNVHGLDRYLKDPSFTPLIAGVYGTAPGHKFETAFSLVHDAEQAKRRLFQMIDGANIVAHNAGFEQGVLHQMGMPLPSYRFIDSAVVARAAGGGSKLEAAAPQLLGIPKGPMGKELIRVFSIPGKLQEANESPMFDPDIIQLELFKWQEFLDYCLLDAKLGYQLVSDYSGRLPAIELEFARATLTMNNEGWFVDLDDVQQMQSIYEMNKADTLERFRDQHDPKGELNFNSFPQLKAWCEERNVKAKSFDEKNVEKMLRMIGKRLMSAANLTHEQVANLSDVQDMLITKQVLGGSSLKKLTTIENLVGEGDRLRDQYVHVGAGQTWRTSGRGVQLQNLKRLKEIANMDELYSNIHLWDNDTLASNLRQVFRAQHKDGRLIVGDFASVESRGLAYEAGEEWKLEAYRNNRDMYKVLASQMFSVHYDDVLKQQRQTGKVGELSCGYGAGGGAVQAFASNMGVEMTELEAAELVRDWRSTNPSVVNLWERLNQAILNAAQDTGTGYVKLAYDLEVEFTRLACPASLQTQHPGAVTVEMRVYNNGTLFARRYFHGVHMRGSQVTYYKPSDLVNGDLWKNHYRDPKTKEIRFFTLYGGKLAGLLTQSICREIFFRSMLELQQRLEHYSNAKLIGQFHDELVVEWQPEPFPERSGRSHLGLAGAENIMEDCMSTTQLRMFPLEAEIKNAHRYIK